MHVCKNSGARWGPRNDGRKRSQESKEGNLYPISPLLRAQGPGQPGILQTRSIPVAHMQTPHMPCSCLVLVGIELDFSSLHNGLEKLFMPAEPLISIISSFPAQNLNLFVPLPSFTAMTFKSLLAAANRFWASPPFQCHPLPWQHLRPHVHHPHRGVPPHRASLCQTEEIQFIYLHHGLCLSIAKVAMRDSQS